MEDLLELVILIIAMGILSLIIFCIIETNDKVIEINDKLNKIIEIKELNQNESI